MTFLPVITRELRQEARRRANYWMRLSATAVAAGVLGFWMVNHGRGMTTGGMPLFLQLHVTILAVIWIFVPIMTADCIARERREGTLGLLFLTPLTARGIVIGKSFVQMLRALVLFLGILPMISIPLLMGGIGVLDLVSALTIQFCSILLAISAGLLASARCRAWVRALLLAEVFAALSATSFVVVLCVGFSIQLDEFHWEWLGMLPWIAFVLIGGSGDGWSATFATALADQHKWLIWLAVVICSVVLWFAWAIFASARSVQKSRSEEPPGKRQLWFLQMFCTPVFWCSVFRGRMRRALERNPIGWLQQYSWSARLGKWAWCLLVMVIETIWLWDGSFRNFVGMQICLGLLLLVGISFSAAGSFRRERESGALELLLVAPLQIHQIVFGRLRGIWSQFLPATWVLLLVLSGARGLLSWESDAAVGFLVYVLWSAFVLPVIGLHLSLRLQSFLAAWMLTLLAGVVVPFFAIGLIDYVIRKFYVPAFLTPTFGQALVFMFLLQGTAVVVSGIRLFKNLQRREFAFSGRRD